MNRTALTIKMLMILKARGTKRPVSTRELADELETNPRNIREFKKELITAGFNIKEKKGPYGGYILQEDTIFPVLPLTKQEIEALNESQEFMKSHKEIKSYSSYCDALTKVLASSKNGKNVSIQYLQNAVRPIEEKIQEMMDLALQAIGCEYTLCIDYQGANDSRVQTLEVDPYDLIHYRNSYYLVGFSHLRNDYRIYRFSAKRMIKMKMTSKHFLWDSQYQLINVVSRFGLIKKDFKNIKVRVNKDVIDRFEEYDGWGIDIKKIAEDAQNVFYEFKNPDRFELYRQIFSFDGKIEIIDPQSYKKEFNKKIVSFLENGDIYDDACK